MANETTGTATGATQLIREFPGVDNATRAERLIRRAALEVGDVERAVMLICAELTGLVPERDIFAHKWPLRQETAYMFQLECEAAETSPDFRSFTGIFAGRSRDRDAVLAAASALEGGLPLVWTTAASGGLTAPVTVAKLEMADGADFGRSTASGGRVFTVGMRLAMRVCTTCPRGC